MDRMELLKILLVDEEGYNPKAHKVKGKMHIGYGHCLDQEQTDDELLVMGLDDEEDDWEGFELSDDQCEALLRIDVEDALEDVLHSFTQEELDALEPARWCAIISMVFQMGGGGLRKFPSFIAAVKAGDWDRAADEMLWSNGLKKQRRSAWYKQTKIRCQEAAEAMRVGYFAEYQDASVVAVPRSDGSEVVVYLSDATIGQLFEEMASRFGIEIEVVHTDRDLA